MIDLFVDTKRTSDTREIDEELAKGLNVYDASKSLFAGHNDDKANES